MAQSTALAEHRDADSERHDVQAVLFGQLPVVAAAASTATAEAGPLVAEELLVEEVSIDGMCGVY